MSELSYDAGKDYLRVRNPSLQQVESCIQALDNETRRGISLSLPSGTLTVGGGNKGRVTVYYRNKTAEGAEMRWGKLLDANDMARIDEIEIAISNGEADVMPYYQTVSKETALEVALHFLVNDTLPPRLAWKGQMDGF